MAQQPVDFSWVSDTVAGFGFPESKENLNYLTNVAKITHIFSLNEEAPKVIDSFPNLKLHHHPIMEFTAPALGLVKTIVEEIAEAEAKGERCGVHCRLGQMRTGTILAAYLVRHCKISGEEAVKKICKMRPKSVIPPANEMVVCEYAELMGFS